MRSFITCRIGFEIFASKELEMKNFSNIDVKEGYVLFESQNAEGLIRFLYTSGIAIRGGIFLDEREIGENLESSKEVLGELSDSVDYISHFHKNLKFKLECQRKGKHSFKSSEFERMLGGMVYDKLEKEGIEPKVDLTNPDVNLFAFLNKNKLLLGIDLIGFDLNKRDYKLFTNSHSIKGDIGRAMIMMGIEELNKGVILDPFSSDGVVGIEAGLYIMGKSHNYYRKRDFLFKKQKLKELEGVDIDNILKEEDAKEKNDVGFNINCFDPLFHNIKSIQKNSKIAGIDKVISISRIEPENIDLKFEDASVDAIITVLINRTKSIQESKLRKYIEGFFERSKQILKKKGKMIIFTDIKEHTEMIEKYDFKIKREIDIGIENKKIFELSK